MAIIATEEISGGLFNSTRVVDTLNGFPKGDKAVDAAFFAKMLSCIISHGIVKGEGEEFKVYPGGDLSIAVTPGIAWGNGYMATLEEDVYFELENGHEYTVFLRFNGTHGKAELMVYEDDHGVIPMRSPSLCDLVLAKVTVGEDTVDITDVMIEDTRDEASLCGFVKSRI
ncbi:MAG: hypothetical protein IKM46_06780 [Clostridia bacterium]|nr:hypothetical protein [Clostridia bacterium]